MRTYRIRPTSVAALEDDDVVIGHDGKPVQGVMAIRSVATTDHTRHLYTLLDRGTISPEVGIDRDCVYSYEPVPCALPIGRNKDNPDNLIYTIN